MNEHFCNYLNKKDQLAYLRIGVGRPLIFLHGGPGDDHQYIRSFAEMFSKDHLCILPDQRGSGRSKILSYDEVTLHLSKFIEDIECLRLHLKEEKLRIIGHSWGAMLGLYYATTYPENVESVVLIGMGPINPEMTEIYQANVLHKLSKEEQNEFKSLRKKRNDFAVQGNHTSQLEVHLEIMKKFFSKLWIYSEAGREQFIKDLPFTNAYNRKVPMNLMKSISEFNLESKLSQLTAPVLIQYGYQDIEPITQAFYLQKNLKNSQIHFINECGHLPWLDQPVLCHQAIENFLKTKTDKYSESK